MIGPRTTGLSTKTRTTGLRTKTRTNGLKARTTWTRMNNLVKDDRRVKGEDADDLEYRSISKIIL